MRAVNRATDQELAEVVVRGSQVRRTPDVVRARLLARARNAVAAREAAPPPIFHWASAAPRRGLRFAVAATVLLAFAAGGAAAMIHSRAMPAGALAVAPVRSAEKSFAPPPPLAPAPLEAPAAPRVTAARPRPFHRALSPQESYAAELALLRRAQSDYTRHDFADALVLAAEHARRFPTGRLAEEREALRVRSLMGASRGDEARRVLAAFARRFPRSVLLPRLREAARTAEE